MPMSGGRADLHIHTTASDGRYSVQDVLKHISQHRKDLNVIAITDHDILDATLWAYEHRHRFPFAIVPGVEVSSRVGHILALWVMQPIPKDLSLEETVQAIHEAGGLAFLAHPFHVSIGDVRHNVMRYLRTPEVLLQAGIDGIETHNAGISTPGSNVLARLLAQRLNLPHLGNSDAHTLGAIGAGVTRFEGTTADALRDAITHKRTQAEGTAWNIKDYIEYLQTERHKTVKPSLAKITS